jgi:hypothetical protein
MRALTKQRATTKRLDEHICSDARPQCWRRESSRVNAVRSHAREPHRGDHRNRVTPSHQALHRPCAIARRAVADEVGAWPPLRWNSIRPRVEEQVTGQIAGGPRNASEHSDYRPPRHLENIVLCFHKTNNHSYIRAPIYSNIYIHAPSGLTLYTRRLNIRR